MAVIDDFKRDCEKARKVYDDMIFYLEQGFLIRPVGRDPEAATQVWLETLRRNSLDLTQLLEQLDDTRQATP